MKLLQIGILIFCYSSLGLGVGIFLAKLNDWLPSKNRDWLINIAFAIIFLAMLGIFMGFSISGARALEIFVFKNCN